MSLEEETKKLKLDLILKIEEVSNQEIAKVSGMEASQTYREMTEIISQCNLETEHLLANKRDLSPALQMERTMVLGSLKQKAEKLKGSCK